MSTGPEPAPPAHDLRRIPPPPGGGRVRYSPRRSGGTGPDGPDPGGPGGPGPGTVGAEAAEADQIPSDGEPPEPRQFVIEMVEGEDEPLPGGHPLVGGGMGGSTDSGPDVDGVEFPDADTDLANRLRSRLADAAAAFEAERFLDADNLLASIERLSPGVTEVMELRALTWYRMGRWRKAATEMMRFAQQTGSYDQHPVLIDCARALKQWTKVEELWDELTYHGAEGPVIEEARIARAGAYADRGQVHEAIAVLESVPLDDAPDIYRLRRWYALADLYERVGDIARARRLFRRLDTAAPQFGDVSQRIRALG